jgi:polysaccharide biosynthesis/export protein
VTGARWPPTGLVTCEHALLNSIIADPSQNIQLAPGDVVNLSYQPRYFLNFGATAAVAATVAIGGAATAFTGRRLSFDAENLTLAEGLAKAGSLLDGRADSRSVFLFRYVPRDVLERLASTYRTSSSPTCPQCSRSTSARPMAIFWQIVYMKHNDLIFVSDHPSVDLLKFLAIVRAITSTTRDAIGVITDIKILQNL